MNRKIRQLAVALIACYIALFAALNYWQVNREEQLESQPDNTRKLIRDFDKPRGPIVTADGVIVAQSVPAEGDSDVKFTRRVPDRRSVRQRDRLPHVRPRLDAGRAHTHRDPHRLDRRATAARHPRLVRWRRRHVGFDPADAASRLPADRQVPARTAGGVDRRARDGHRRRAGDVELPQLRPQPDRQPRLRRRLRGPHRAAGGSRRSAARQRLPAALHARLGVQGVHHQHRPRRRRGHPRQLLRRREPVRAPANRPTRSRTTADRPAVATSPTVFARSCNTPFARIAVDLGPERFVAGTHAMGVRRADPDRPPAPGGQHHRRHVRPRREPAAPRDPRLRPERGPVGADPHGDGRRRGRQRRRR